MGRPFFCVLCDVVIQTIADAANTSITWIKNNHFDLSDLREGPHTMRCNAGFEDGMQSSHLPIIAKSTTTIPLPTLHPPITPLQVRFMPLTISHNRIQYYSQ
jgi:hypothetical protein